MRHMLAVLAVIASPLAHGADFKTVGSIKGADGPWDYAEVDSEVNRLLVGRGDGVMAVDLATGAVTDTLVPGHRVHGVIALPGGLAASANGETSDLTLFKASDGTVLATIPLGDKPDALVREPKTGLVASMNHAAGTVSLVDIARKAMVGNIAVGGVLEFAAADGDGRVFVNIEDKNEVAVLDLPSRSVTAHWPLTDCERPTGLASDAVHHLLVAACANGKAVAISSADGHVIAALPIASRPDAVIFDQKNKRFLVPCGGDGVLSVIWDEGGQLAAAGTIPTEKGARTGALDPATGRVYLPTAEYEPAKPGERPAAVPGTFHILVVGEK